VQCSHLLSEPDHTDRPYQQQTQATAQTISTLQRQPREHTGERDEVRPFHDTDEEDLIPSRERHLRGTDEDSQKSAAKGSSDDDDDARCTGISFGLDEGVPACVKRGGKKDEEEGQERKGPAYFAERSRVKFATAVPAV